MNACQQCKTDTLFPLPFTMAFQPIVDVRSGSVYAHEALVRGTNGAGAGTILASVDSANRYAFDQSCRVKAIELASSLGLANTPAFLSINFMPNAVYEPRACIRRTLEAAGKTGFPTEKIIFEFTENEKLDTKHLLNIMNAYRAMGFKTAIDDFGAGYAGLGLLSKFQPDLVKLDMDIIRDIDTVPVKQTIVRNIVKLLDDLGVTLICEGVETAGELTVLVDLGVNYIQGYHIAQPQFEALTPPVLPFRSATERPGRL